MDIPSGVYKYLGIPHFIVLTWTSGFCVRSMVAMSVLMIVDRLTCKTIHIDGALIGNRLVHFKTRYVYVQKTDRDEKLWQFH